MRDSYTLKYLPQWFPVILYTLINKARGRNHDIKILLYSRTNKNNKVQESRTDKFWTLSDQIDERVQTRVRPKAWLYHWCLVPAGTWGKETGAVCVYSGAAVVICPGSRSREGLSYQIVSVLFHWAKHKRGGVRVGISYRRYWLEKLSVVNSSSFDVSLKVEDNYMLGFILFLKQDLTHSRLAS